METDGKRPILCKEEWDFSVQSLPESEVRACLIWECARECAEIAQAIEARDLKERLAPERWDRAENAFVINARRTRDAARGALNRLGFDPDAHLKRLIRCHECASPFYDQVLTYGGPGADPWLALGPSVRREMALLVSRTRNTPIRASYMNEVHDLWKVNIGTLPDGEASAEEAFEIESQPVEIHPGEDDPTDKQIVASLTINFSRYTNRELLDCFKAWLTTARCCPPPVRRGKKRNDLRSALDGIGMMRAMHHFQFSDPEFPRPLRDRGARACYKGRDLALKRFHDMLPFVLAESKPISWSTLSRLNASKSTPI